MNGIESRLRESLETAATRVQPHTEARAENLDRIARGRRTRRLAATGTAGLVAATVAASFVIVGQSGSLDRSSAKPKTSQTPFDRFRYNFLMHNYPPVTQVLRLDPPRGGLGNSMLFWFGYGKPGSDGKKELSSCTFTVGGDTGDGCGEFQSLRRNETVRLGPPNGINVRDPRQSISITGWARNGVAEVTAVMPDGTEVPGSIGRGRGFPAAVWRITLPADRLTNRSFVTLHFLTNSPKRRITTISLTVRPVHRT